MVLLRKMEGLEGEISSPYFCAIILSAIAYIYVYCS